MGILNISLVGDLVLYMGCKRLRTQGAYTGTSERSTQSLPSLLLFREKSLFYTC